MEIRDPIHGTIHLNDDETAVIDSPEFQRLRSIKQLGFSEFSFPGATHNRYLHSIGACHLAGMAFDHIFKNFAFRSQSQRKNLRQVLRLASLLHDIGHGPLSHTTEEVMPLVEKLRLPLLKRSNNLPPTGRKSTHEDYTLKFVLDSDLTGVLIQRFPELDPLHVAGLIDHTIIIEDDFFIADGINIRPVLGQLVSSELDVDRMDYLERDSYFCGTNYGKFDLPWLISNLMPYSINGAAHLAVNRRALYTFDDFLLSRHHMHLMVYFHHKSIVYEELLHRYLTSKDCDFFLPPEINLYTHCTDHALYEHLAGSKNPWAKRIALRRPYRVLTELHTTSESERPEVIRQALANLGIDPIVASSSVRLSKYHSLSPEQRGPSIYVVDLYDRQDKPVPLDQSTEIFRRYEGTRMIYRIYVAPEDHERANRILESLFAVPEASV